MVKRTKKEINTEETNQNKKNEKNVKNDTKKENKKTQKINKNLEMKEKVSKDKSKENKDKKEEEIEEEKSLENTKEKINIKQTKINKAKSTNNEKENQKKQTQKKDSKNKENYIENDNNEQSNCIIQDSIIVENYNKKLEEIKQKLLPQISDKQLTKALTVLNSYIRKKNKESKLNILNLNQDMYLYVNFLFAKYPVSYSHFPVPIKVSNGLLGEKYSSNICLFVKKPKSDFKNLELQFPFNLKVIDTNSLELKYKTFEKRRELVKSYDLFLCDGRIKHILKKMLGKPFFDSKKFPCPINIDYDKKEETLKNIIDVVSNNIIFYMSNGPNYSVKFAKLSLDIEKQKQNLKDVIEKTLPHILKYNIDNIELRSIVIKGLDTIEIPVFNQLKETDIKSYLKNI